MAKKPATFEGLPVEDARHALVINIKKPDILNAKKNDPANCAAAKAVKREVGTEARVYKTRTYVKIGKNWVRFMTPEAITREITAFDRGAKFMPGEYFLAPPSPTQRLDYRVKPSGKRTGKGKSTKPRHVTTSVRKWEDRGKK